jgi:hypothetical protein
LSADPALRSGRAPHTAVEKRGRESPVTVAMTSEWRRPGYPVVALRLPGRVPPDVVVLAEDEPEESLVRALDFALSQLLVERCLHGAPPVQQTIRARAPEKAAATPRWTSRLTELVRRNKRTDVASISSVGAGRSIELPGFCGTAHSNGPVLSVVRVAYANC